MKIRRDTLRLVEQFLNEVELDTTSLDLQIDKYLNTYEKASQKNADKLTLSECLSLLLEDEADELIDKILGNNSKKSATDDENEEDAQNDNKKKSKKKKEPDLDFDLDEPTSASKKQEKEPAATDTDSEELQEPQEQLPVPGAGDVGGLEQSDAGDVTNAAEEQPVQKQRPGQIDVNVFASKVSNLVNNIENLLDIKSVIINRAHDIINTNYGEKDAKAFKQSLATKYSLQSADAYDKPY